MGYWESTPLKARADGNGKLAATGFCYGGGVSNLVVGTMGEDLAAAAPCYGSATPSAA
jgi:carboxymethylenebutenolidase